MGNTSDRFYNRFNFLYPVVDAFMKAQKRKFFNMINLYPSGRLLEIGVGNGDHLKYYQTHNIIAIDTSERMLESAMRHKQKDIQLLKMNGEDLLFQNETFDYVILSHVIAVVDDPNKVLQEVHRVLKPGGRVFILNHFTPDNWLKYFDRLLTLISRLLYFRSVFHINSLRQIEKFKLLGAFNASPFSYFKILIYEKNV